ncbi:hypothetical protein PSTG_02180 [Puccinia striiformis f. sp. tritici PST-78]|uniref:Uncharacterized protein n=1 Tax=Puccinia striiformis f. sp. tritici PST-78 TaxID=1165861 RepID=A0A0L0W0A0_9BASI|nr:hypothetical protein PSTG_02180 [Puccinia striiformis f. sp. tritici PST-78]
MIFWAAIQQFWAHIRQPASRRCESAPLSGHNFLCGVPAEHGKNSNSEGTTHVQGDQAGHHLWPH